MIVSIQRGATFAWRRLRLERGLLAPIVAVAFVALVAELERGSGPAVAADRALAGATFGLALPLLALALLHRLAPGMRLDVALLPVTRRGHDRRGALLGALGTVGLATAACGTVLAVIAVVVARGGAGEHLAGDLAASAWIGALGGATYATMLGLGACMGPRGGGRWTLLILDGLLGVGTGFIALPWPRSHLRNLLGADAALALPQAVAAPCLVLLLVLAAGVAAARTER